MKRHGGALAAGGPWVFGYGSLVWRPSIPFLEREPAWIDGWVRRFWQGSTDHRGVPGAPGRVVTLVEEPGARCWGMAYRLEPGGAAGVLAQLDHREQGGYDRRELVIHFRDRPPVPGLVYVATPENPNYLGPAPLETIAEQVLRSRGPSGVNLEYVECLARALREIGVEDEHVFALAGVIGTALRRGLGAPGAGGGELASGGVEATPEDLHDLVDVRPLEHERR